MSKMIFVSLPVSNLSASVRFYTALGFTVNPAFSDDSAAWLGWSENIVFMLLTHEKWRSFTTRPIAPSSMSEMGLALTCDSRAAVDAMNAAAAANGGVADVNPVQEHGFMYGRDMADPDGHIVGALWMDPAAGSAAE